MTMLSENIRALREAYGDKQAAFAERLDVHQSYVSKWERGEVEPRNENRDRLALLAGCSFSDLQTKRWSRPPVAEQPSTVSVDAGETVSILRLNLALPMGQGATVDDYIEEEPFTFDLGYVRTFTRTPPDRLRLALGVGDSMFPTLMSSDLVWIDSTQRVLNQSDRIWAVSINGAAAIKRLRPLKDNRVLVISDNKAIGDYEVGRDEILIGGRVIRFARDV